MKILLLALMLISFSYASEIDSLLNDYEQESELSKKTKDESAGNLIVYTRDDLERMQAESLQDVLKSLRLLAYIENRMGQPDILNQDPLIYYSSTIRVYLNETELLTAMTGSGLILFGNMELDFIDHIEIYQGFPSFDFGIEPATIVIRLYTKTAEHDEGGRVKATLSSNGANKENVYYTNQENGISYFMYANRTDDKKDTYTHDNQTLGRSTTTNRFYGSLGVENHTFNFHVMKHEGDIFMGPYIGNIPNNTDIQNSFINLSTESKFMNDSLLVNLSYTKTENETLAEYDPLKGPYAPLSITSYFLQQKEESLTATVKKEWSLENHELSIGAQYRYKSFDIDDPIINGIPTTFGLPYSYNNENIYSLYIQDLISLNENSLLTLSVMDQEYVRDNNIKNQNTLQLRLGYIYTNQEWVSKTFLSSQEFAPEPYMTMNGKDLEETSYTSFQQEVSYQTPKTLSKIIVGYGTTEGMLIPGASGIVNSDINTELYNAVMEFTLYFNNKDKLELQANYWYLESPITGGDDTEHLSYVVRMLNTLSDFDIFNELVIHTGFADVDTGYDYSAGVKYHVSKDFQINVKGVNIFDTGLERSYINQINFTTGQTTDAVTVPVIERRFTLGLEYLF